MEASLSGADVQAVGIGMPLPVFIAGVYSDWPATTLGQSFKIFNNLSYELCVFAVMGSWASHFTSEY